VPVTIAKPFTIGRYAVMCDEFAAFVAASGHNTYGDCRIYFGAGYERQSGRNWRSPGFTQDGRHPVVCVTWDDAQAYAAWLKGHC